MLEINFKLCCENCPDRKTYINETGMQADNRTVSVLTVLGCEHESVCRFYVNPNTFRRDMKLKNSYIDRRRDEDEK